MHFTKADKPNTENKNSCAYLAEQGTWTELIVPIPSWCNDWGVAHIE
jgi:hypothetical protein